MAALVGDVGESGLRRPVRSDGSEFLSDGDAPADVARRFVAKRRVRVQVLSLPRCTERWAAADAHAREVTLAHVPSAVGELDAGREPCADFVMGGGVDASVVKAALRGECAAPLHRHAM